MAEPQAQDSTPAPDISSLVGPPDDKSIASLTTGLKSAQAAKVQDDERLSREFDSTAARDKMLRDRAFAAEGVAANEMPRPWNAEAEHKRFETNPIEGFGSVGGIFAMVASAFTKAPMENAINGMAGAINSIKEGNEAAYQRAYDSFKENVKLADHRFKMQHELYEDALSIGSADIAASQAKFHNAATRFGDRKALMLMEAGMYPELYELIDARAKSHAQMMKMAEDIDLHQVQKAAIDSIKMNPPNTGDPVQDKMQLAAQIQRIYDGGGKYGTAEQEAVGRYVQQNWRKNPQEFADGLAELHQQFHGAETEARRQEYTEQRIQAYRDANSGKDPPAEELAKITSEAAALGRTPHGAAGGGQSTQARKTRAIEEIQQKHAAEGKPISLADAEREYNKTVQIPSAHDVHQDDVQYAKAERMEGAMDEMEQLLLKHKFITGIGGTLTRPVEAFSNVLGSNATDRKQFQRVATELKEWGQSVVNDRTGRPLSAEARDAAVIFAGLNPQDTGPNTIRAINELRPVIKKIKADILARGQGRGPVSGGGGASSAPAGTEEPTKKDAPWLGDPVKSEAPGKQSSASEAPPVEGARKAPDGNWYVEDPHRQGKYLQVMIG